MLKSLLMPTYFYVLCKVLILVFDSDPCLEVLHNRGNHRRVFV